MNQTLSRRQVLASSAVVISGLAGCSDDPDVSSVVEDDSPSDEMSDDDELEDQNDDEIQDSSSDQETFEQVDPEDTGLVVTQTTINDISIEDAWVILQATVSVENVGDSAYRLIEIRLDAYRTTPDAERQTALGFSYASRTFGSSSPFEDGTEQLQVEVAIPRNEAPRQLNTDWFDVTAVVRRADEA